MVFVINTVGDVMSLLQVYWSCYIHLVSCQCVNLLVVIGNCDNYRLSGASPFLGDNDGETMQNILDGEVEFPDEYFNDVSTMAKDMIKGLLISDPR